MENEVRLLDAALEKICADTYGSVVITDLAERTVFEKLCAYGCVKRSNERQPHNGSRYESTEAGRNLYRSGGFVKERLIQKQIQSVIDLAACQQQSAETAVNLAKSQRRDARTTVWVAIGTLIVLIVQVTITCLSYFCGKS
jgi:hypothetical protein